MRQYVILERREKRPRRLRIGIPICLTAIVELKYYRIKYYRIKCHLRQCIIFISIGEWPRVYYLLKWYN